MADPLTTTARPSRELGEWSWVLGFVVAGIANSTVAGVSVRAELTARAWFHLYDVLHFASLGFLAAGAAWAASRFATRRVPAWILNASPWMVAGLVLLPAELRGPALRIELATGFGRSAPLLAVVVAAGVPFAEAFGRRFSAKGLRRFALLVPCAMAPVNISILTHQHPGAHLFLASAGAAVVAGSFRDSRLRVPDRAWFGAAAAVSVCFASLILPPPPAGGAILSQISGSVLYPFIARVHAARVRSWMPDELPEGAWFVARDSTRSLEPSDVDHHPPKITILLTIDAMRADILANPVLSARVPRLASLRDRGVTFTHAWSPSNSTVPSLTTLFTGKYYSQLYWTRLDDGTRNAELWPHADESVRFPELLSEAGVRSVTYAPAYWLVSRFGVVRGFDDEDWVRSENSIAPRHLSRWSSAESTIGRLRKRLRALKPDSPPVFFYIHILEPHYPYDQGQVHDGDDFDRYLSELSVVDEEIGRLLDALETLGLADETAMVITADHGEAFGEHATTKHDSTLYDEALRVPVILVIPNVPPREIDTPVSLIDLGPTILDMYRVPVPESYMGQSLLPLALGGTDDLTRPVAFEAFPMQGMAFRDGTKVIRNLDTGLLEVYDLDADPGELRNLHGGFLDSFDQYFGPLAVFFDVHQLRMPGYEVAPRRPR